MENLDVAGSLESLDRVAQNTTPLKGADKFANRRIELAKAALETLATLGYARTSLREIAQHTKFSHGVLHYYFSDKTDLITCCVSYYKSVCVTRYDDAVISAKDPDQLLERFIEKLIETLEQEAPLHRLWYDIRAQSLFEDAFAEDVAIIDASLRDMVWRVCSQYCALSGGVPALSPRALYAAFDGLFQQALFDFIQGVPGAAEGLRDEVRAMLPRIISMRKAD